MTPYSRRRFLATSGTAGSLLLVGTRSTRLIAGANDRIRIAVIGVNGRGREHLAGFSKVPGVEIAAIVDTDQAVLDRTLADLAKKAGDTPLATKGERDFRRVLDDPSIDAISIAAPNHWHSLMTILGAQAGKHVYVEKPLSHDVAEAASPSRPRKNTVWLSSTAPSGGAMPASPGCTRRSRTAPSRG